MRLLEVWCVCFRRAPNNTVPGMESLLSELDKLTSYKPTSNDGKTVMSPFVKLFTEFLSHLDVKFDDFKTELHAVSKAKDDKIFLLEGEIENLKKLFGNQEDKLDDLNQYGRRESLVFSGDSVPAVTENENPVQVVCELISSKLTNIDSRIAPSDFSIVHRLGPKPRDGVPDRRKIIARFCRRALKYRVLKAARDAKPANFFVQENLTPTRQKIFRALGKAKKDHPQSIAGYTSNDGAISVWVKPPNPNAPGAKNSRITINTVAKLEDFCRKEFQCPASRFLPTSRT